MSKPNLDFDEDVPVPVLKAAEAVYRGLPRPDYPTLLSLIHDGINGHRLPATNWKKPGGKRDQWRISIRAYRDFLRAVEEDSNRPCTTHNPNRRRADEARERIRTMR